MLATGPMALTALLLIQSSTEIETGARLETRIGEFPTGEQQGEIRVLAVATPRLGLNWYAGTDALSASLTSRILWIAMPWYGQSPLFLQTLVLQHTARPSPRSDWRLGLQASYGKQDYTSLSQQLQNQPTLPLAATMLMAGGTGVLRWRASRRTSTSLSLEVTHRRSLDAMDPGGASSTGSYALPIQTTVNTAPALQLSATRRLAVTLSAPITDSDIRQTGNDLVQATHFNILSVQPQLGASGQVTRRHRLQLAAGMTYAIPIVEDVSPTGDRVSPLGSIGLESELYNGASTRLGSAVNSGITWMMDPVLGSGRLRSVSSVNLSSQMENRWNAGARAVFVTDISKAPETNLPVDGTLFSIDCSVTYRRPQAFLVELGGRFAERGPRLDSPGFEWRGRELWVFFAMSSGARTTLTGTRSTWNTAGR